MTSDGPILTIGVPVYNGAALLADMLDSLREQTFTDFRVIICDNASTDATATIAQSFAERDERFTYTRNETNIGAAPNFNRVFELGRSTPFFKWAAHDDVYAPTYLERCMALMASDPTAVVVYPITVMVDETREGVAPDEMCLRASVLDSFIDTEGRPAWTMGPLNLAEGDDPVRRLDDYLNRMTASFEIFGVMRTAALERTTLHASYYGSDRALLSQMVLMGRFRQVPERLYFNRFHQAASRRMTRQDQSKWIDPLGSPKWRIMTMYGDILAAPTIAGLGPIDHLRSWLVTLSNFSRRQFGRAMRKIARVSGLSGRIEAPAAGAGKTAGRTSV